MGRGGIRTPRSLLGDASNPTGIYRVGSEDDHTAEEAPMSDPHGHGHPGQREPRSHGETHHELRRANLNSASKEELADLPMVGPKRAPAGHMPVLRA